MSVESDYIASEYLMLNPDKVYTPEELQNLQQFNQTARQQLPQEYETQNIQQQLDQTDYQNIQRDPQAQFRRAWELYTSGKYVNNDDDMRYLRAMIQSSKRELLNRDIDPSGVLSDKKVAGKIFDFIGRVLTVPTNAVSLLAEKVYNPNSPLNTTQRGSEERARYVGEQLWNPTGYERNVRDIAGLSPAYIQLKKKVEENLPLTPEEQTQWRQYQTGITVGGLAANMFLDPLNLIGGQVTKANEVKKLAQLTPGQELNQGAHLITNYLLEHADDIADEGIRASVRNALSRVSASQDLLNQNNLDDIGRIARTVFGQGSEVAQNSDKAITRLYQHIDDINAARSTVGTASVSHNALNGLSETRAGEAAQQVGDVVRRAFGSDVPYAYKPAFDEARQMRTFIANHADDLGNEVSKLINDAARKANVSYDDFSRAVSDAIERNIFDNTPVGQIASRIKNQYDDILIGEIGLEGNRIHPLGLEQANIEKWDNLANNLAEQLKLTPYDLRGINETKSELKSMIAHRPLSLDQIIIRPNNIDDLTKLDLGYNMHGLTEEARKFIKEYYGKLQRASSVGGNTSLLPREFLRGVTIEKANDILKNLTPQIAKELGIGDEAFAFWNKFRETFPEASAFITDPARLIRARQLKSTQLFYNNVLINGLQELAKSDTAFKLISPTYRKGLQKLIINGVEIGYTHPDVVREAARANQLLSDTPQLIKIYDKILKFLRASTLLPFVSYYSRNMVGNVFNMSLAGWNPLKNGMKFMEWSRSLFHADEIGKFDFIKNFKMITSDGRIITGESLIEKAKQLNVINAGDIFEDAYKGTTIKPLGWLSKKAGSNLEGISKMTLFIDRLMKGDDFKAAARVVHKYLFDYNDLTHFENNVIKRMTFFYTWMKKNMILQLSPNSLFSKTNRTLYKTIAAFENANPDQVVDERRMADYLTEQQMLKLNKDPARQQEMLIALENLIPQGQLGVAARLLGSGSAKELFSNLSPIIKVPIELMLNRDVFRNKEIQRVEGETKEFLGFRLPVRVVYALNSLFRPASSANTLGFGRGNQEQLSWAGYASNIPPSSIGSKVTYALLARPVQYDAAFSKIMQSRNIIGEIQDQLNYVYGEIKRLESSYSGRQYPKNDINRIVNYYSNILNAYHAAIDEGLIDDADARVNSYIKSSWNNILKMMQYYYETSPEGANIHGNI